LLGKGCLLFSLVLSYERSPALRDIGASYRFILRIMRDALADLISNIELAGTSDLAAGNFKFSGNSQQRKRMYLLHHGTLLYDFPLRDMGRYLHSPARQPAYRRRRLHGDFVRNLPATAEELRRRLRAAWEASQTATDWPTSVVQRLVKEKYQTTAWSYRR
jgi:lipoate-protein ligase A